MIYYNYLLNNTVQSGSASTNQDSARIPILLGSIETPCYVKTDVTDSSPPPPPPPPSDLIIHFDANDPTSYPGSGDTWINIGSGGITYNATLLGNTGLPIFDNSAISSFQFTLNFLGSSIDYYDYNYMTFLRPDAISDDFTWCAWINTTEVGYGFNHYELMYIVSTETPNVNNDFGFGIDANGALAYGDGSLGGHDITMSSNTLVNTGVWTFVAVTREKATGSVVLYINGIADTSGTCNVGNTLSTATDVLIGSETDSPGFTFGGRIGAVLGNIKVLTADDILQLFNDQRGTYGV